MGFWWGHMQKYHDSPPCKRYLLSCWGKTKKGFKLLSPSNNLKWMLLYLCKKLWPVLAPFYLCAHAPGMQLSPTWWHHVGMSKIVVQAMWWLGYLVPEMCKRIQFQLQANMLSHTIQNERKSFNPIQIERKSFNLCKEYVNDSICFHDFWVVN